MAHNKGIVSMTITFFLEGDQFQETDKPTDQEVSDMGDNVMSALVREANEIGLSPDDAEFTIREIHVTVGGKRKVATFQ